MSVDVSSSSLERPSRWSAIFPVCSLACRRRVLNSKHGVQTRADQSAASLPAPAAVPAAIPPGLALGDPPFGVLLRQGPIPPKGIEIWCHQSLICKTAMATMRTFSDPLRKEFAQNQPHDRHLLISTAGSAGPEGPQIAAQPPNLLWPSSPKEQRASSTTCMSAPDPIPVFIPKSQELMRS